MTLVQIVEAQRELDRRIHEERGLDTKLTIKNRVVALTVELAEMANEMRFFKYWSNKTLNEERILEEAADCFHFIVSLGNEYGHTPEFTDPVKVNGPGPSELYLEMLRYITDFGGLKDFYNYAMLCKYFEQLLAYYNITKKDLYREYERKNQINHQRQDEGY